MDDLNEEDAGWDRADWYRQRVAEYLEDNPKPPPTAPVVDIYDWHYGRSMAEGIDDDDADILAQGFVSRYTR